MKFSIVPCSTLCILLLSTTVAFSGNPAPVNNAPNELAGFKLDSFIGDYDDIPSYHTFLQEIVVRDIDGFRKGSIFYGVCAEPGEIIKMRFKLKNRTIKFYEQLLKSFKRKYGPPHDFIGDTFGEIIAWKWIFKDKEENKITLILQHNRGDTEETMGSEIKLQMPDRLQQERNCFNKKLTAASQQKQEQSGGIDEMSDDQLIQLMTPR